MVSLPNHLGTSVAQLPGGEIVEPSGLRSVEMGRFGKFSERVGLGIDKQDRSFHHTQTTGTGRWGVEG